jgi:general stress protein 26
MDSINKQQRENNFKHLHGDKATEKIKKLVGKGSTCFFCTNIQTGKAFETRPMSVQKVDDNGCLWFLSADDSHKNIEILDDPNVQLLFKGSDYSDFLSIYGIANVSKNKEKIKELWEPILKTWFTDGVDDSRITVIKIEPLEGYYWDTKNNMLVGLIKRLAGAATGKTMDDSIEGNLDV